MPRPVSRLPLLLLSLGTVALLTSCGATPGSHNPSSSTSPNPNRITPTITWAQPAPINNPTSLGPAQLDATASVPGSFVYSPAAETVLAPGTQTLTTTFEPTDRADYNSAAASVTLVVNTGGNTATCGSGMETDAAAYIYVSGGTPGNFQLDGYSAAADGALTPLPGSPLPTSGDSPLITVGAGSILFGIDGSNIDSYRVNPGGCPGLETSKPVASAANSGIVIAGLYLDPEADNLYSYSSNESLDGTDPEFTSWSFNRQTGQLNQLGAEAGDAGKIVAFSSNDQYAISPRCAARMGPSLTEYARGGNGSLTLLGNVTWPDVPTGSSLCPMVAAADGSGHFVVGMGVEQGGPPSNDSSNPDLFATYSIDGSGGMSTASTWQNMQSSTLGWLRSLQFSPNGRYLAVSGYSGLQVFAWDSSTMTLTPIATIQSEAWCTDTACSGAGFGNVAWDENDHLYTILGQQLLVYAVNLSGVAPAPGSPYILHNPQWVTVLPENSQ